MIEKLKDKFTKYEVARILGARSLQLAMDAPILIKLSKEEIEDLNYDSLRLAEKELESGVLPITIRRPLPKKSEKTIKKISLEEIKEKLEEESEKTEKKEKIIDKVTAETEVKEEKEGEIMEMANPDDEAVEEESDSSEEV
jgi:DNA-directed RNA polymerase subunit K